MELDPNSEVALCTCPCHIGEECGDEITPGHCSAIGPCCDRSGKLDRDPKCTCEVGIGVENPRAHSINCGLRIAEENRSPVERSIEVPPERWPDRIRWYYPLPSVDQLAYLLEQYPDQYMLSPDGTLMFNEDHVRVIPIQPLDDQDESIDVSDLPEEMAIEYPEFESGVAVIPPSGNIHVELTEQIGQYQITYRADTVEHLEQMIRGACRIQSEKNLKVDPDILNNQAEDLAILLEFKSLVHASFDGSRVSNFGTDDYPIVNRLREVAAALEAYRTLKSCNSLADALDCKCGIGCRAHNCPVHKSDDL